LCVPHFDQKLDEQPRLNWFLARLASLALGTGDLDCVYHFALAELQEAVEEISNKDQLDMLLGMIDGRRLRDISDLPFDLAT
jgi:hypothetical protein